MSTLEQRRARFEAKFDVDKSGCWIWKGGKSANGYGWFWWEVQNERANRASWMLYRGDIGDKLVLHKCHNRLCVNPDHLYLGDHEQNMRDRDECGHTSRGSHRYNFKRRENLIERIKSAVLEGLQLREVIEKLGIGWQTLYRARAQDSSLDAIIRQTKSARYSKASRAR